MLLDLPLGLAFLPSSYFFFLIGLQGLDGPLTPTGLLPNYYPGAADRLGKSAACSKVFFLIDGCLAKKMRTLAWLVRKVHSAILSKPPQGIKNLLKMKIRSC